MAHKPHPTVSLVRTVLILVAAASTAAAWAADRVPTDAAAKAALKKIGTRKGICAVLGLPRADQPGYVTGLARGSELSVYFQSPSADEVVQVRKAAEAAGLLGKRVFVDRGDFRSVHLGDNLADAVLVSPSAERSTDEEELLRILHPEGKAVLGDREIVKPAPRGTDAWSHPYHGPDNNPQSVDQIARAPYLTQFLAGPKFCPMPEVTVAAGGRIFKAFGHIAHKANQNAMLNTLLCVNAYNGTILWQRPLKRGYMIHRNAMIATAETLYLADDESCKLIDAGSGEVGDEIVIAEGIADGPVWKWMALEDGVLYALVGGEEVKPRTTSSDVPGLGHWPWGMWEGHEYKDPKTNFGFGRNLVAIDPRTKEILWNHREEDYLDSRGICMKNGRIYFYSPEKFLGCLDAKAGKVLWKTSAGDLLEAIGPNGRAQHYVTGYATTTYVKCDDHYLFFAGPQRNRLVAASAKDGRLLWQKEHGNLQLVLREDGVYAAGPGTTGCKLAYESGQVLDHLPTRRACTRSTGSVDSVFYRTTGGTVRVDTASNTAQHIAPMRPPCQDGVIISDGLLFWGPWMCGCQLSFYGHVGLAPAGDFDFQPGPDGSRLETGQGDVTSVEKFEVEPGDWPCYGGNDQRTCVTEVALPRRVSRRWAFRPSSPCMPTAPVVAGGMVFVGDHSGVLRALDAEGKPRWKAYAGGAAFYPPAVSQGRLYMGSADGRVYAFEAATGRRLWSFRVAPAEQWIPVYGKLISRWPVAGGVVVHDGVVYAAAGIAHYDGTHVVALDEVTGKVKWYNDTSGKISRNVDCGISLQGNVHLRGSELCFAGGGKYQTARYDLQTGKCLNPPNQTVQSGFQTAFYPYYPEYGQYLSLDYTYADGRSLNYNASYEGSRHTPLKLLGPTAPGVPRAASGAAARRGAPQRETLWQDKSGRRFNSFAVSPSVLLAAGQSGPYNAPQYFLAAIDVRDGSDIWQKRLPAAVVKGGTAVDCQGRIIVCLETGQVLCFQ